MYCLRFANVPTHCPTTALFLPVTASKHPGRITNRLASSDSAIGCVDWAAEGAAQLVDHRILSEAPPHRCSVGISQENSKGIRWIASRSSNQSPRLARPNDTDGSLHGRLLVVVPYAAWEPTSTAPSMVRA